MTRPVVAFTEQRAWLDSNGQVRGLKSLPIVEGLADRVPVRLVVRVSGTGDQGVLLAPSAGKVKLKWPARATEVPLGLLRAGLTVGREVASSSVIHTDQPGIIGGLGVLLAAPFRRPMVVNVVGDPAESVSTMVMPGWKGEIASRLLPAVQRWVAAHAVYANYVTREVLQNRYPAVRAHKSFASTTSVPLGPDRPRSFPDPSETVSIVTVGSLEQAYKGVDDLIEAVRICRAAGIDMLLTVVGQGRLQRDLERQGAELGEGVIRFTGYLFGEALYRELGRHDVFALASWTEGLPRALVEAMLDGLPAVATGVGGVPELLEPERIAPRRDPQALADRLQSLLADEQAWNRSVARNRTVARELSEGSGDARTDFIESSAALAKNSGLVPPSQTRRVKVLHVINKLEVGGAERMLLELCRGSARSKVLQNVVTLSGKRGAWSHRFEAEQAQEFPLKLRASPEFAVAFLRLLRSLKPDVVVSHVSLFSGVILTFARAAGVPTRVAAMHSDGDGHGNSLSRRAYRSVTRRLLRRMATHVIGGTASSLGFAGKVQGEASVIPYGINVEDFDLQDRAEARERLGLPQGGTLLLHCGRAAPEKNRAKLGDILAASPADHTLVLVGSDQVDDLGLPSDSPLWARIIIRGKQEDLAPYFNAADILLLPSIREGLPLVILESMACGTPVVASDLPGIRSVACSLPAIRLVPPDESGQQFLAAADQILEQGISREEMRRAVVGGQFDSATMVAKWGVLWA